MPVWKIQIQTTVIWNKTNRQHVPGKIDKVFKELPNVFGTDDGIFVTGNDDNGRDHNNTLGRVLRICREVNLKKKKQR